eukprot:UC1_evm1s890
MTAVEASASASASAPDAAAAAAGPPPPSSPTATTTRTVAGGGTCRLSMDLRWIVLKFAEALTLPGGVATAADGGAPTLPDNEGYCDLSELASLPQLKSQLELSVDDIAGVLRWAQDWELSPNGDRYRASTASSMRARRGRFNKGPATIFVGNLSPQQATEDLLHELFLQAGPVREVFIPSRSGKGGGVLDGGGGGSSSTFGFVDMVDE